MKKRAQLIKYLLSDFVSTALAWLIFNVLRYYLIAEDQGFSTLSQFLLSYNVLRGQILIPFGWLVLHYYSGYYNSAIERSRLSEFFTTAATSFLGTIVIFFVVVLKTLPESVPIYYQQFFSLFGITFLLTYIGRSIITGRTLKKIKNREYAHDILILGNGNKAQEITEQLKKPSDTIGYSIQGYINIDQNTPHPTAEFFPALGTLDDLEELIKELKTEELVIAIDSDDNDDLLNLLYSLYQYKLPIKVPISYNRLLTSGMRVKTLVGAPLADVTANNFSASEKNIKYTFDKLISGLVLILISPLYLYLAIRVKRDSQGPIFLKQERIGYRGKPFTIYKFRTMREDAEKEGPSLSSINDDRITPYGQIMRKYRLDELPQFWNVLKGDMSLVGPRPERKFYIEQIAKKAPYYYLLHNVRPGITSWGMVKFGYASDLDQMTERLQYDILYYENMSLGLDTKILIYTIKTIVTGKGI